MLRLDECIKAQPKPHYKVTSAPLGTEWNLIVKHFKDNNWAPSLVLESCANNMSITIGQRIR